MCTDTEVAEFVWVLDKWEGCAYLKAVRVCVCVRVRLCPCVFVCEADRLGSPRGQSLGNRRCLSKTAFNEIHAADTQPSGRFSSM